MDGLEGEEEEEEEVERLMAFGLPARAVFE
jgi:hypothetical protein